MFQQAQALTTLGDRPLAVVTASENLTTEGWKGAQDRIAALSTNRLHRTADSTHAGLLEDPHGARESVRAITQSSPRPAPARRWTRSDLPMPRPGGLDRLRPLVRSSIGSRYGATR